MEFKPILLVLLCLALFVVAQVTTQSNNVVDDGI